MTDILDTPLVDVRVASAMIDGPWHRPLQDAAHNLLAKAEKALIVGDEERAERLVQRALAVPYDEHEEADTALFVGHLRVFMAVVDELEESDEDDDAWLEAALHVLDTGSDAMRDHMYRVLRTVLKDYRPTQAETHRLKAALQRHPVPPVLEPDDVRSDELLPHDERAEIVRAAVRAVALFQRTLDEV